MESDGPGKKTVLDGLGKMAVKAADRVVVSDVYRYRDELFPKLHPSRLREEPTVQWRAQKRTRDGVGARVQAGVRWSSELGKSQRRCVPLAWCPWCCFQKTARSRSMCGGQGCFLLSLFLPCEHRPSRAGGEHRMSETCLRVPCIGCAGVEKVGVGLSSSRDDLGGLHASAGVDSQMQTMGSGTQPMHVLRRNRESPVQGRPLGAKAGRLMACMLSVLHPRGWAGVLALYLARPLFCSVLLLLLLLRR
jgi:hypothetical protein